MKTHAEIVKFTTKEQPGATPVGMKTEQTAHPSKSAALIFLQSQVKVNI